MPHLAKSLQTTSSSACFPTAQPEKPIIQPIKMKLSRENPFLQWKIFRSPLMDISWEEYQYSKRYDKAKASYDHSKLSKSAYVVLAVGGRRLGANTQICDRLCQIRTPCSTDRNFQNSPSMITENPNNSNPKP